MRTRSAFAARRLALALAIRRRRARARTRRSRCRSPRMASSASKMRNWIRTSGSRALGADADRVLLDSAAIDAQNAAMLAQDPTIIDLAALPASLTASRCASGSKTCRAPDAHAVRRAGTRSCPRRRSTDSSTPSRSMRSRHRRRPATAWSSTRRRCARSRPRCASSSRRRHRHRPLPGKRAVPRHAGRDRCTRAATASGGSSSARAIAAWIETATRRRRHARRRCSAYARKSPYLVVTGAKVAHRLHAANCRRSRSCSSTWACALPLRRLARRRAGQRPASLHRARHRAADRATPTARCASRRRCCRRTPTSQADYLPLTRANLLRQGFKFLGERYGWGHSYNARDCSGFVSEVYRSFGVQLPRNTRDQARQPGAAIASRSTTPTIAQRAAAVLRDAAGRRPGLHPRPRDDGDRPRSTASPTSSTTPPASAIATPTASCARVHLNGVSVTPLAAAAVRRNAPLRRPHHQHRPRRHAALIHEDRHA